MLGAARLIWKVRCSGHVLSIRYRVWLACGLHCLFVAWFFHARWASDAQTLVDVIGGIIFLPQFVALLAVNGCAETWSTFVFIFVALVASFPLSLLYGFALEWLFVGRKRAG